MARTAIAVQNAVGPHPSGVVAAGALDYVYANSDSANGNSFVPTGKEVLLIQNTNVGVQTVTITSKVDPFGRLNTITAYSLAANDFAAFWFGSEIGWKQNDGLIHLDTSADDVQFAVLKLG